MMVWFKKISVASALATVMMTSFFGICLMQHEPFAAHHGQHLTWSGGQSDADCPLMDIGDLKFSDKTSGADFGMIKKEAYPADSFSTALTYEVAEADISIKTVSETKERDYRRLDLPISITSPPLVRAFSQGILHPKKDLEA